MKRFGTGAALMIVAAVALSGCLDTLSIPGPSNPADPANPGTNSRIPDTPAGLTATVSDRMVDLAWTVSDTLQIEYYRVYRWEVEDGGEDFELLDTSDEMLYADTDVRNGQEYMYMVSSVNRLGLEGESSAKISVVPQIFAVTINQGALKTSSRSVTLRMSAGFATGLMQVSNSPDLTDAQWEPYQSSYSWSLEAGDGTKSVYVRFRDPDDNESATVSDEIELDTKAVIESVTHDTDGAEMAAGDVIHVTLTANELNGEASASLGTVVPGLTLYDDGTNGDALAADGVYERDYTIEQGVEMMGASVIGSFTDEVGNEAEPVVATGTVTILDPPPAVEMDEPIALSESALALSWSMSNVQDFSSYKLYRAPDPDVATSEDRELIETSTVSSDTDYTDRNLDPATTYYYAVFVVDQNGLSTMSNVVTGLTLENDPPVPVELYAPWVVSDSVALEISWSRNSDTDFMYYELVGWEQDPPNPPATSESRVLTRVYSRDETFFTHSSLSPSIVYWYEVVVVDSFGAESSSNIVSGSPVSK